MKIRHEATSASVRRAIEAGDQRSAPDLAKAFRVPVSTVNRIRGEIARSKQKGFFE